jgi:hypothetical protein
LKLEVKRLGIGVETTRGLQNKINPSVEIRKSVRATYEATLKINHYSAIDTINLKIGCLAFFSRGWISLASLRLSNKAA